VTDESGVELADLILAVYFKVVLLLDEFLDGQSLIRLELPAEEEYFKFFEDSHEQVVLFFAYHFIYVGLDETELDGVGFQVGLEDVDHNVLVVLIAREAVQQDDELALVLHGDHLPEFQSRLPEVVQLAEVQYFLQDLGVLRLAEGHVVGHHLFEAAFVEGQLHEV